jgi:hypothetical protein
MPTKLLQILRCAKCGEQDQADEWYETCTKPGCGGAMVWIADVQR